MGRPPVGGWGSWAVAGRPPAEMGWGTAPEQAPAVGLLGVVAVAVGRPTVGDWGTAPQKAGDWEISAQQAVGSGFWAVAGRLRVGDSGTLARRAGGLGYWAVKAVGCGGKAPAVEVAAGGEVPVHKSALAYMIVLGFRCTDTLNRSRRHP